MPPELARFGVRATTSIDEAVADADVVMMLRIQHERMHGHFIPVDARVLHAVRPDAGAGRARQAGRDHHAPRPDEPRRRDRFRRRRRPILGDPRAGHQRRRRPDGGACTCSPDRKRTASSCRAKGKGQDWAEMKLLLKGGRVVDPANGRDGEFDVLIEDGRDRAHRQVAAGRRRRGARGEARLDRGARPDRHPRAPARAGAGAQGDDRDRPRVRGRRRIHRRRLHAEHRSGERSSRHHRADPAEGGRRRISRASIRSARSRWRRAASRCRSWARRRPPAASRSPTTGGRWRARC